VIPVIGKIGLKTKLKLNSRQKNDYLPNIRFNSKIKNNPGRICHKKIRSISRSAKLFAESSALSKKGPFFICFSVALGDNTGMIKLVDSTTLSVLSLFKAHSSKINQIKQFPNGLVATASEDTLVKIWNPSSACSNWSLIQVYAGHAPQGATQVEYINADTLVSVGINDANIRIWSISTGQTQRTIGTGTNPFSLQLLSNGIYLAAGLNSQNINIYDVTTGNLVSTIVERSFNGYADNDLALINGDTLASAGSDYFVRILNLTTNRVIFNLSGHTNQVTKVKLIAKDILASASLDATIKIWNTTDGTLLRTLACHLNQIFNSLDLMSDGQTLVSGSMDTTLKFWNYETGELLNTINTAFSAINSLAVVNTTIQQSKN